MKYIVLFLLMMTAYTECRTISFVVLRTRMLFQCIKVLECEPVHDVNTYKEHVELLLASRMIPEMYSVRWPFVDWHLKRDAHIECGFCLHSAECSHMLSWIHKTSNYMEQWES